MTVQVKRQTGVITRLGDPPRPARPLEGTGRCGQIPPPHDEYRNLRRLKQRMAIQQYYVPLRRILCAFARIVAGLSFQCTILSKLHLRGARIFVTGMNLLTFTKYPGGDPEIARDFENATDRNLSPNIYLPHLRNKNHGW